MGRVSKCEVSLATLLATAAALILVLLPGVSLAQDSNRAAVVSGELVGLQPGASLQVELRGSGVVSGTMWAHVSFSGDFRFHDVEEGMYELLVTDVTGHPIHREFVTVSRDRNLRIWLPPQERFSARAPAGTVSAAQLQRKVPRRAVDEYHAALEELQRDEMAKAIHHLQKALTVAPDFMEAHNELGACMLKEERLEEAAGEFRIAANLDPGAVVPMSNLGVVLFALKRFSEAEAAARQALRLNPARSRTRYLLGMSLHAQGQFDRETLGYLKGVADEFPEARLALAETLSQLGRKEEAVVQVKQYLLQPGGKRSRSNVELWLAELQK